MNDLNFDYYEFVNLMIPKIIFEILLQNNTRKSNNAKVSVSST